MLKIDIVASGSSGNCYIVEDAGQKIIIDPGINYKRIQRASNFKLTSYDFCLISHEHKDHCQAAKDIAKLGIPILTSAGTFDAMNIEFADFYRLHSETEVKLKNWKVLPFSLQHDAVEPLGFLVLSPSGSKLLYATDTYYIRYRFRAVTHYMVECNYSMDILRSNKSIPKKVKDRIISSHFELENVKKFFSKEDLSKTRKIYLIHLSENNSDENRFNKEIESLTGIPVYGISASAR